VSAVTSFLGISVQNPILNASDYLARVFPNAAFEIILLPFWLLFRGFKTPEAPEHLVAA